MLEEFEEILIDSINTTNKTISIVKDIIIKKNGIQIAKSRHRQAFVPGDIETVKEYLGVEESPEITYLESIWTEEAIEAYQESLEV